MMHKTDNKTLVEAMLVLSAEIQSGDGVANAAIAEAADRINELAEIALELLAHTSCEQSLPAGCPRCELSGRLAAMGGRS